MPLRPYQIDGINRLRASFARGRRRVVFVAPGGSGKTVCAAHVIQGAMAKGQQILFVCDREELVQQCSDRLTVEGIPHGFVKAGRRHEADHQVYVASIQTLARRPRAAPGTTLIVVDECDQNLAGQHRILLDRWPDSRIIGLTATPIRTDGKGLGRVYDDLVEIATPAQLIADGWLIQPTVYAPSNPELAGVKVIAGDYDPEQLGKEMSRPKLVGAVVDHWRVHGQGKRAMLFACTVAHSQALVTELRTAGCRAEHLDATTPKEIRSAALNSLRAHDLDVISNVGLFPRGWDMPSLEVVIVARPTQSMSLHLQMALRVARISPETGKTRAILVDHAGNTHRHGFVQDEREWSLEDRPKKLGPKPEAPVKVCKTCFCVVPAACLVCPECDAEFEMAGRKKLEVVPDQLTELTPSIQLDRMARQRRVQDFACFSALGAARGYKPGWAALTWQRKYHCWPSRVVRLAADHVPADITAGLVAAFEAAEAAERAAKAKPDPFRMATDLFNGGLIHG